jgi:hypothetical protein
VARKQNDSNGGVGIESAILRSAKYIEHYASIIDIELKTQYGVFLAEPLPEYWIYLLDEFERQETWT